MRRLIKLILALCILFPLGCQTKSQEKIVVKKKERREPKSFQLKTSVLYADTNNQLLSFKENDTLTLDFDTLFSGAIEVRFSDIPHVTFIHQNKELTNSDKIQIKNSKQVTFIYHYEPLKEAMFIRKWKDLRCVTETSWQHPIVLPSFVFYNKNGMPLRLESDSKIVHQQPSNELLQSKEVTNYFLAFDSTSIVDFRWQFSEEELAEKGVQVKKVVSNTDEQSSIQSKLWTFEDTDEFVELIKLDSTFLLDMKYATDDNFLKKDVYTCPNCFLRKSAATQIVKAQKELRQKGYSFKFFDCYRPLSVQKKMWAIFPHPGYVANPYKGIGSMHNKGIAVDLTLSTLEGEELDMGTPFDFFGKEAHHTYLEHTDTIQANRDLLKNTMAKYGFKHIRTEWWHYSLVGKGPHRVADAPICKE